MKKQFILLSLLLLFSGPALAESHSEIEIVFDASGSMNDPMEGGTRLDAAKKALMEISEVISPESNVGLRVFGASRLHNPESCKDSILTMPIASFKKEEMVSQAMALKSYGSTAIGFSLQEASKDFSSAAEKTIILISDGEETCGYDPLKVMESLKAQGFQIKIHTVGFAASSAGKAQLKTLADATGGTFHEAESAAELVASVKEISKTENMLLAPKNSDEGPNILAASEGARIVSSSTPLFANLIDGVEDRVGAFGHGDEVIFSFKGGQPVLFDKFLVPVFKTEASNFGAIKLYASVDKPDSGFLKILDLRPDNKVAFGNVYQEFKVDPPRPLRYLKVALGNAANDSRITGIWAEEWKAVGKYLTEEEFKARVQSLPAVDINLLAQENGGQFIAGSRGGFKDLINVKNDDFGGTVDLAPGEEAIFGFKDGKTAVLTKIGIPILEAAPANIKTIEISISETTPSGPFTTVGQFVVANLVFANNPVQEFTFDQPVKAKYLKIKFVDNQEKYFESRAYEVLAMGHFE